MDRAALTRLGLDVLVQLDRVLLQLRHVRVAVQRVHPTGRVPRRSRGQLLAFDQHDVGPAGLGEVVQHRRADHTAADHHDLRCSHFIERRLAARRSVVGRHAALGDAAGDEFVELLTDRRVHRRRLVRVEELAGECAARAGASGLPASSHVS